MRLKSGSKGLLYFLNWRDASHQDVMQHKMPYTTIGCNRDNQGVIEFLKTLPADAILVVGSLETDRIYSIVANGKTIQANNILIADTVWPNDKYEATNYTTLLMMNPVGIPIQKSHRIQKAVRCGKSKQPSIKEVIGIPVTGGNQTLFAIEEQQYCAMRDDLSASLQRP